MTKYDMEADYEAFMASLPSLVDRSRGKFAVVHDGKIVTVIESMEEAIEYGARQFGFEQFIAQEITDAEPRVLSYSMLV